MPPLPQSCCARPGREGENTLISPLSVALALGMTANGAAGDTLAEFQDLFGMDLDTLNAYCVKALRDYSDLGGSTRSTLVNSLWCDPDLTLEDEFIARCQQNYGAELYQTDLQDAATVRAVNNWVSKATEGLIPKTWRNFRRTRSSPWSMPSTSRISLSGPLRRPALSGRWTSPPPTARCPTLGGCITARGRSGTSPMPAAPGRSCPMTTGGWASCSCSRRRGCRPLRLPVRLGRYHREKPAGRQGGAAGVPHRSQV